MSRDTDLLRQLEGELKIKLIRRSFEDLLCHVQDVPTTAYDSDKEGNVIALVLEGIQIHTFPRTVLGFAELRLLSFAWNYLDSLPPEIASLKHLKHLRLYDNRLRRLPRELLDLGLNFITDHSWFNGPEDHSIRVGLNPLVTPPIEVLSQGRDAVLRYYAALAGERSEVNEIKVLFVGDGGAGKTCLSKLLRGDSFDPNEPQTHGINLSVSQAVLEQRHITLRFWDFGGQDIMHATHLFFFSHRSTYVLVLDGRKEEDPEYWLKHIESLGGESPVLVVLNKMDENPAFEVNRRYLRAKYKGVVDFYPVSCKTGTGIAEVQNGLAEATRRVQIVQTDWPSSWLRVKQGIEAIETPFFSSENYESMCLQAGIGDQAEQEDLLRFLNDLGVAIHFPDFNLNHMHVLEPKWLTGGVYRVLTSPILARQHGTLSLATLTDILRRRKEGTDYEYPRYTHPFIIELMKKFELCYALDDATVLVPDLLNIQEPPLEFDQENALHFRVDFDFLPRSVMPRLIVRMHKDIYRGVLWRSGFLVHDDSFDATALVRSDERERRIYVYVIGTHRRDYLTVIRTTLSEVTDSFDKLLSREQVCMPDSPMVTVSFKHLLHLEKTGIAQVYPDGATHAYSVQELLGSVGVEHSRTEADFVRLLRKIIVDSENRESAISKANRVIALQPNFFGLGINLNEIVDALLVRRKKPQN